MNSLLKRSFASNSPRFSFLTVSLYGTRERERERERERKKKAVVRRLPRCYFLTVSLYCTLRTIKAKKKNMLVSGNVSKFFWVGR